VNKNYQLNLNCSIKL